MGAAEPKLSRAAAAFNPDVMPERFFLRRVIRRLLLGILPSCSEKVLRLAHFGGLATRPHQACGTRSGARILNLS